MVRNAALILFLFTISLAQIGYGAGAGEPTATPSPTPCESQDCPDPIQQWDTDGPFTVSASLKSGQNNVITRLCPSTVYDPVQKSIAILTSRYDIHTSDSDKYINKSWHWHGFPECQYVLTDNSEVINYTDSGYINLTILSWPDYTVEGTQSIVFKVEDFEDIVGVGAGTGIKDPPAQDSVTVLICGDYIPGQESPDTRITPPTFTGAYFSGQQKQDLYTGGTYQLTCDRGTDKDKMYCEQNNEVSCTEGDDMSDSYPRWSSVNGGTFPNGNQGVSVAYIPPKDVNYTFFNIEENDLSSLADDPATIYAIATTSSFDVHWPKYVDISRLMSSLVQTNSQGCKVGVQKVYEWKIFDNHLQEYSPPAPFSGQEHNQLTYQNQCISGSGSVQDNKPLYASPYYDNISWTITDSNDQPLPDNSQAVSSEPCLSVSCDPGVLIIKTQSIEVTFGNATWNPLKWNIGTGYSQWYIVFCRSGDSCMDVDYYPTSPTLTSCPGCP